MKQSRSREEKTEIYKYLLKILNESGGRIFPQGEENRNSPNWSGPGKVKAKKKTPALHVEATKTSRTR